MTSSQALEQLKTRVQYLIEHARTPHKLGVVAYTPAAFGEAYHAIYLRDFTYMAEGAPEFVPLEHTRAIIELFLANRSAEGLCPERISDSGEVFYVCHGPRPAADCAMFLVKLCAAYRDNGGDAAFVDAIYPALAKALATVPIHPESGLVYIDPAAPSTAYGFTDTIAITGEHLFCSLLLLEAKEILSRFAKLSNRDDDVNKHATDAARIRRSLDRLWSDEQQLYFAGSQDCRQADVWGSAYACAIAALSDERRAEVARSLWEKRDRLLWRAQVRHLLTPEHWQKLIVNEAWTAPSQFQNGAYWGTATGWIAQAFEAHRKGEGIALLCELASEFDEHGVWECVGPGGYQRTANNVSTAVLPYAALSLLLK